MSTECLNKVVIADRVCDYIPLVSSLTNLVDIFQKCVILSSKNRITIENNHYYEYLKDKSYARCIILLIPILGNIIVAIFDLVNKRGIENEALTSNVAKIEQNFLSNKELLKEIDKWPKDKCYLKSAIHQLVEGRSLEGDVSQHYGPYLMSLCRELVVVNPITDSIYKNFWELGENQNYMAFEFSIKKSKNLNHALLLIINMEKETVEFYDSFGHKVEDNKDLKVVGIDLPLGEFISRAKKFYNCENFKFIENNKKHQKNPMKECGVYALYKLATIVEEIMGIKILSPKKGDGFNDKYIKVVRNAMANQLFANGEKILNYIRQRNDKIIKGKKGRIIPSFF